MQLHIKPKQPFYSPLTLPRRLAYLENRSVNPAYILGISPWLDDLDRRPVYIPAPAFSERVVAADLKNGLRCSADIDLRSVQTNANTTMALAVAATPGCANFVSDNTAGCMPEVLSAIIAAAQGTAPAYGNDDQTQKLNAVFSKVTFCTMLLNNPRHFIRDARVHPPDGPLCQHTATRFATRLDWLVAKRPRQR